MKYLEKHGDCGQHVNLDHVVQVNCTDETTIKFVTVNDTEIT